MAELRGSVRHGVPGSYGDREFTWCEADGRVVSPEADTATRIMGAAPDSSERERSEEAYQRLEARLIQSQKMESVGRLAGGIAHDFNNLLTVILGNCDVLLDTARTATRAEREDALMEIQAAGHRARSLTQQLLAYSRRQVLELSRLDLNLVIQDFRKMLERLIGEDITLVTLLGGVPLEIQADRSQIEQIVLNLVVNARDSMRRGGRLTLRCGRARMGGSLPLSSGSVPPPGDYAELLAIDTGCGMSPEVLAHVFEPFFTTKEVGEGTGLGLATVQGIVKQHGGHIEVLSTVGSGTTFRVLLPLAEGIAERPHVEPPKAVDVHGAGERILVVEDDPGVRKLTVSFLVGSSYSVIEADRPEAALLAAETGSPIDLLLTDVIMPRQSGREIYAALAKRQPHLKVLYMSGYLDNVIAKHGVLSTDTHLLRKPFSRQQLLQKVREVLTDSWVETSRG